MRAARINKFIAVLMALALTAATLAACRSEGQPTTTTPPPNDPTKPDVVLIGSEIEGVYLARAARDEGLNVVVLDPREKPGGQLIEGEMLYLDEPFADGGKSLLQGKVKQLFDAYKKGDIRKKEEFKRYYDSLLDGIAVESGIQITNVSFSQDAKTSKRSIDSITYLTKDRQSKTIRSRYWVENTDFAALTSRLGLTRIPGIETVFDAPGVAKDYMASSIMMKFKNVDWAKFQKEVNKLSHKEIEEKYGAETNVTDMFTWGFGNVGASYKSTRKELFLRGLNTVNQGNGEVLINALLIYNVDPANEASVRTALEWGRQETERILPHLRQWLPGWENAELNGFPDYLYVRDYDRYETEYVLQASDLMSGRMFWDDVSVAGYPIDLQGTLTHTWGTRVGDPDKYGMPLRAFLPKGYANVLTAGKNIGASAVAYGSARIQPQTALAGEVIGHMMGRLGRDRLLSAVSESEMKKLQDYVQETAGIKLRGGEGKNKIPKLTEEQRQQLNKGKFELK